MISKFQATLEVTLICLGVMFFAMFVGGCASQPSILDTMQTKPTLSASLSDATIITYWDSVASRYGMKTQVGDLVSTGGQLTLASLATAMLVTAPKGGGAAIGIAAAANWILQALGIIRPTDRAVAHGLSHVGLRTALGVYVLGRANRAHTIPISCVSTEGAALFASTMEMENRVELTLLQIFPPDPAGGQQPSSLQRALAAPIPGQAGCQ